MDDYHSTTPWHSLEIEEVMKKLNTSKEGLSDAEAAIRLKKNGPNKLRKKRNKSIWHMLWEQIKDPMIIILIGAAILSFSLKEELEGFVILIIISINGVVSIIQEKKAEASLESLRKMTASYAICLRQGEESKVLAEDIVVGDIVILEDGAKIPADIRLIDSSSLKVLESSLTGESVSSIKDSDDDLQDDCSLLDRTTMVYASTFITYGRGIGVVVATGMDTEIGHIAQLIDDQDELETPIKKKLTSVGKVLTIVGILICLIIFAIGYLYKQPLVPLLMTAISLAISIIPEGLPATSTIVLALGVQRMAKQGAIIRKLPAVETLGSATVICSDKTGTLTLNQMVVTNMASNGDFTQNKYRKVKEAISIKENYEELVQAGALCNNSSFDPDNPGHILGDPTEGALIMLTKEFGKDHEDLEDIYPRVFEKPFDSERKRMTTAHKIGDNVVCYTKGAVDEVLSVCTKIVTKDGDRPITKADVDSVKKLSDNMAEGALRVLSFAKRNLDHIPDDEENVEFDLTFIGIVGMMDPPREEVKAAVKTCYNAGVRTVMITGDHKITAVAIARELGIWRNGDTVYSGSEISEMSEDKLDKIVKTTSVYARVSPEQKLKIVQALQRTGEVASMTGDGVNDAPALKAAHIGVAMGVSGTDVAKESADMVLTDDNFTTIVYAVEGGRRVYSNIQKVIQFLLAGNISEILTILIAVIFNFPAPLLAVHILWVNLATDTLPALALGVDPAEKDIMKRKPIKSGTLFESDLIFRVVIQGVFIATATLLAFFVGYRDDLLSGQAMAFCTIAFSQLFYSFSQRSNTSTIFSKDIFRNKYLVGSIIISAGLMFMLIFITPIREAFQLSTLDADEWVIIFVLSLIPVMLIELMKFITMIAKRKKEQFV